MYFNLSELGLLILLNLEQDQINKQQHLVTKGQKKPFPEGLYFTGYSGGSQKPSLNVVFQHHINQYKIQLVKQFMIKQTCKATYNNLPEYVSLLPEVLATIQVIIHKIWIL